MRNSLNQLLEKFPYFLDRSKESNFYKSEWVFNEWFKEVYNDLFITYCSHKLSKPLLIWKTQEANYEYGINFAVVLDNLKTVIIYKNGVEIYREDYQEQEEVGSFYYLHEDTSTEIIPHDSYLLYAESYNEYSLMKGYPENDDAEFINTTSTTNADGSIDLNIQTSAPELQEVQIRVDDSEVETYYENINKTYTISEPNLYNTYYIHIDTGEDIVYYEKRWNKLDSYCHDSSLDELGIQYSMPRKKYSYSHYHDGWKNTYYPKTEPPWNNRYTEDDYHYMNRIIGYTSAYHTTPLPVLELWKLFGIESTMENRNDLLCKMYEEALHNENWIPDDDFSHKNLQYVEEDPEDALRLLYVGVDNSTPFEGTPVNFDLTLYNRYFDVLDMLGVLEVYERNNEGVLKLIDTINDAPLNKWVYDTNKSGGSTHAFVFRYYNTIEEYNLKEVTAESDEVYIQILGCDDADIFVSPEGDDSNAGTASKPVKTLERAMELVEDSKNIVFLSKGEYNLSNTLAVFKSCTIAHCYNGSSNIISPRQEIFNISPNTILNLVNIDSWYNNSLYSAVLDTHSNTSKTGLNHFVIVNGENTRIPVVFMVDTKKCRVGSECILKGTLKTEAGAIVSGKEVKVSMADEEYTATTDSKGEFSISLGAFSTLGEITVNLDSETDDTYKYCLTDAVIIIKKYNTTLTVTSDKSTVNVGDTISLTGMLVDEDNTPLGNVSIKDSTRGVLATTSSSGVWSYSKTTTTSGVESFKLSANVDTDYYNAPSNVSTSITVNKLDTMVVVSSDASNYKIGATATVSAKLTTLSGTAINGATVIIDGVSCTTNSNGVASRTFSCTATGSVSKTVTYNGDNKYKSCTGKVSYIVTEKTTTQMETTVLNGQYLNDTATVTVSLIDSVNKTPLAGVSISDGTTSKTTDSNGKVSFTYLNSVEGAVSKTYTYSGDSEYAGATGTAKWTISKRPSVISLSTDKTSCDLEESVTFTGMLRDDINDTGIGNSTVEIVKATTIVGGKETVLATVTTDSEGVFSKTMTLPSLGDYDIFVRFDNTDVYIGAMSSSVSINVTKVDTVLTTTVDNPKVYVGGHAQVTVTLKSVHGKVLANQIINDSGTTMTTGADGMVNISYVATTAGYYTKSYSYAGSDVYNSSNASVSFSVVDKDVPVLSVAVSKSSVYVGDTVTVTCTLKSSTGAVISGASVSDGSTSATTNSNGVATFTYSNSASGSVTKSYSYGGSSEYASATGKASWTVSKYNTSLTVTSDKSSYYVGGTATVSATLKTSTGVAVSGASVVIDGVTCTTNSNGVASRSISCSATGTVSKSVSYAGDGKYNSSTGSVSYTVSLKPTTTTLVASATSISLGESVTLTATVKDSDGNGVPNCTILLDVSDSTPQTLTANADGVASYTVSRANVGSVSFTATFTGNSTYEESSSGSVTVVWSDTPVTPKLTLTADSLIGENGDTLPLLLTSNLSGGTVSLVDSDDGTTYATATINSDGSATLNYPCTGLGDLAVMAKYDSTTSNNLNIEDCDYYDPMNTNQLSRYTKSSNLTVTSTGEYYQITQAQHSSYGYLNLTDTSFTNKIILEYDFYNVADNNQNNQLRIGLYNPDNSNKGIIYNLLQNSQSILGCELRTGTSKNTSRDGWSIMKSYSTSSTSGVWYHVKQEYNDSTMKITITSPTGEVILSEEYTTPTGYLESTGNLFCIEHCYTMGATTYLKNVRIKDAKTNVSISASLSKDAYSPNETITLTGTVTGLNNPTGVGVLATIDESSSTLTTLSSTGTFTATLPNSMGNHTVVLDLDISHNKYNVEGVTLNYLVTPLSLTADTLIGESGDVLSLNVASNLSEGSEVQLVDSDDGTVYTTATISSDGTATLEYPCTGLGDRNVVAEYINGSDITTSNIQCLEDCIKYGFNGTETWAQKGATSMIPSYAEGELIAKSTSDSWVVSDISWTIPSGKWVVEFDAKYIDPTSGDGMKFGVQSTNVSSRDGYEATFARSERFWNLLYCRTTSDTPSKIYGPDSEYHHIKILANGNVLQLYYDNTLKTTGTNIPWLSSTLNITMSSWGDYVTGYFKNLKIKPYSE